MKALNLPQFRFVFHCIHFIEGGLNIADLTLMLRCYLPIGPLSQSQTVVSPKPRPKCCLINLATQLKTALDDEYVECFRYMDICAYVHTNGCQFYA